MEIKSGDSVVIGNGKWTYIVCSITTSRGIRKAELRFKDPFSRTGANSRYEEYVNNLIKV